MHPGQDVPEIDSLHPFEAVHARPSQRVLTDPFGQAGAKRISHDVGRH